MTTDPSGKTALPSRSDDVIVDTAPKKVMVFGTSVANQIAVAMSPAFAEYGTEVRNESGALIVRYGEAGPLGRPQEEWRAAVDAFDPDVVIVQTLFAEPELRCQGTDEEKRSCAEIGANKAVEYLMRDMVENLSADGATVLWMTFPNVTDGFTKSTGLMYDTGTRVDRAAEKVAESDQRLHVAYTHVGINGADGEFALWKQYGSAFRQVRTFDGLHLCPAGAEAAVDVVGALLYKDWDPVGGNWRAGPWRTSDTFTKQAYPYSVPVCDDAPSPTPGTWPQGAAG